MNSLRFELIKFLDFCCNTVATCKTSWHSIFRAVFKDTRRRPRIFVYMNLIISTVAILVFGIKNSGGIKRHTETVYRWMFVAVTGLVLVMGLFLVYAFRKRKHILCKVWCISETFLLLAYLLLTLSESVVIAWPGLSYLGVIAAIKLHGLWVIYYFSLELKYSPDSHREIAENMKIEYFVPPTNRREMKRRETDQTSIASSPPSAANDELNGDDECNDSVLDDDSPTGVSFKFFGNDHSASQRELQYSEIMMQGHSHHAAKIDLESIPPVSISPIPSSSKDNIIISDLMCGGSSGLNMELER